MDDGARVAPLIHTDSNVRTAGADQNMNGQTLRRRGRGDDVMSRRSRKSRNQSTNEQSTRRQRACPIGVRRVRWESSSSSHGGHIGISIVRNERQFLCSRSSRHWLKLESQFSPASHLRCSFVWSVDRAGPERREIRVNPFEFWLNVLPLCWPVRVSTK
jgi:hypothetical protein